MARDVINPVTWGAPLMGLKATRSMSIPMSAPPMKTNMIITGKEILPLMTSPRVINAPIMTMSPWAKLISRMIP